MTVPHAGAVTRHQGVSTTCVSDELRRSSCGQVREQIFWGKVGGHFLAVD